jgi:hypothetical protein
MESDPHADLPGRCFAPELILRATTAAAPQKPLIPIPASEHLLGVDPAQRETAASLYERVAAYP